MICSPYQGIGLLTFIVQDTSNGGAKEDRTPDLLRARQALSQLSYGPNSIPPGRSAAPVTLVGLGGVEPPTSPLSGVRSNQLSYRPRCVLSSK
jgi:hypothetical protein